VAEKNVGRLSVMQPTVDSRMIENRTGQTSLPNGIRCEWKFHFCKPEIHIANFQTFISLTLFDELFTVIYTWSSLQL